MLVFRKVKLQTLFWGRIYRKRYKWKKQKFSQLCSLQNFGVQGWWLGDLTLQKLWDKLDAQHWHRWCCMVAFSEGEHQNERGMEGMEGWSHGITSAYFKPTTIRSQDGFDPVALNGAGLGWGHDWGMLTFLHVAHMFNATKPLLWGDLSALHPLMRRQFKITVLPAWRPEPIVRPIQLKTL